MIHLYKHISDYYCSPVHNLQAHELSTVVRTQHVAEIQHASVAVTQHPPGTPAGLWVGTDIVSAY